MVKRSDIVAFSCLTGASQVTPVSMASNPDYCVLLVRAKAQSERYADELRDTLAMNIDIIISPLLRIEAVKTGIDYDDVHTLLFTSSNAVGEFVRRESRRDIPCLCVGNRTTEKAVSAGFTAISANGTADDLLDLSKRHAIGKTGKFLHLRGKHVARALVESLNEDGLKAEQVVIYEQASQALSKQALEKLQSQRNIIVPLFSPRSAALLLKQVKGSDLRGLSAVCISHNVADVVRAAPFRDVHIAKEPTSADVTREIAAIL